MADSTSIVLKKYREWLVCQRYSDTTLRTYDKIANQFIEFWGKKPLARVRPSNIHDFLLSLAYRDLSADVVRRNLWELRSFFDFLCLRGLVDWRMLISQIECCGSKASTENREEYSEGSAPRYIR